MHFCAKRFVVRRRFNLDFRPFVRPLVRPRIFKISRHGFLGGARMQLSTGSLTQRCFGILKKEGR